MLWAGTPKATHEGLSACFIVVLMMSMSGFVDNSNEKYYLGRNAHVSVTWSARGARSPLPRPVMAEGYNKAEYDQRWHDAWQQGVAPGRKWDVGDTAPALAQFLDSGFISVEGKAAYVPGCGRGYDAVELARRGAQTTGLDLAPESIEEANKHLQSKDVASISGTVQFVSGDYFTYRTDTPWVDVGYDFTLRNDWARTWCKVVKSGGYLITLEWPIRPDDKSGPPWPVSPQIYADLLIPLGFKNVYYKEVDQASLSHPRLPGAEVLACFQKL